MMTAAISSCLLDLAAIWPPSTNSQLFFSALPLGQLHSLLLLRVRPKECHALQTKHGGSCRLLLAYAGASDYYIDQVRHDRQQVTAQATMPLYIPASSRRIDQVCIR